MLHTFTFIISGIKPRRKGHLARDAVNVAVQQVSAVQTPQISSLSTNEKPQRKGGWPYMVPVYLPLFGAFYTIRMAEQVFGAVQTVA